MNNPAKIRLLSTIMIVFVSLFFVFWTVEYFDRIYTHIVVADWSEYTFIDATFEKTISVQTLFFLFYLPVIAAAFWSFQYATRVLLNFRKLEVFTLKAAKDVKFLGIGFVLVAIVDTLIPMFERPLMTLWNEAGPLAPRYFYDAGDITIGLAGIGFFMLGWVMQEACKLETENKAFV